MKKTVYFLSLLCAFFSYNLLASPFQLQLSQSKETLNPNQFLKPVSEIPNSFNNNFLNFSTKSYTKISPDVALIDYIPLGEEANMACRSSLQLGRTFEEKISACSSLIHSIVWQDARGSFIPFESWSQDQKNRINEIYQRFFTSANLGLNCPNPTNNYLPYYPATTRLRMFLHPSEAFDIYAAQVAFSVYLEANHTLPWSILNLPQIQLDEIFNSSNYHIPIEDPINLPAGIRAGEDYQLPFRNSMELNCDPRVGYWFLRGLTNTSSQDFIGSNPKQTLENITFWAKNNVVSLHGDQEFIADVPLYQLSYLYGRLRAGDYYGRHGIPAPLGCHSTTRLLYDLAKSVNIPLISVSLREYNYTDRDNFLTVPFHQSVHSGLVAFAGSFQERVLYRADDITQYTTLFPTHEDGRRLSDQETISLYFDTNWVSYSELERWGLTLFRDLPTVSTRSINFGTVQEAGYPNFGRLLGYWNWYTYAQDHFNLYDYYQTQKAYSLCSADLVNDYCRQGTRENFVRVYGASDDSDPRVRGAVAHPSSYFPPNTLTADDFYNRAQQCVNAYGGCEAIARSNRDWPTMQFGLTTIR